MKEYTYMPYEEAPELPKKGPYRTNEFAVEMYQQPEDKVTGPGWQEEGYLRIQIRNSHSIVDEDGNWSHDGKEGVALRVPIKALLPMAEGESYPVITLQPEIKFPEVVAKNKEE